MAAAIRGGASENAAQEVEKPGREPLPRDAEWMSWNVRDTYRGLRAA